MKKLHWVYIYGPPRTGSTYLLRQFRKKAIHSVSDWGLGMILKPFVYMPGGIDKNRLLKDLSENLLHRSRKNKTGEIELVLKAANANFEEYQCYNQMFGLPARTIFTVREPSGYMSSARKKFPEESIAFLQKSYLKMLVLYSRIGGEIIDYNSTLDQEFYRKFLLPLKYKYGELESFEFKGKKADHLVKEKMIVAYRKFIQKNRDKVFKL